MSKTITLAGDNADPAPRAYRAVELRRGGSTYEAIADELGCSAWDAVTLLSIGYAGMMTETADMMRASSEDRILGVIRQAHRDLVLTESASARVHLMRLILDADSRLSRLYGLEIPPGLPDAPPEDA